MTKQLCNLTTDVIGLTLKNSEGWIPPIEYGYGLYSFNFHQNFSNFIFGESCLMSAFTKFFFGKLRMIYLYLRDIHTDLAHWKTVLLVNLK